MSHANGRIYIDTTTTPHKGIDVRGDIATVLGVNTGDVGQLCRDNGGRINIWAKYKPFRSSGFIVTDQQRENANFGLSFPILHSVNSTSGSGTIYNQYENDTEEAIKKRRNGWEYLKPRGGTISEWYRVLDFNGYYHDAEVPLTAGDGAEHAVSTQLETSTVLSAIHRASETFDVGEIDIAQMPNLADFYFCVVGFRVIAGVIQNDQFFIVSGANKISAGEGNFAAGVYFTATNFPAARLGSWYVYPCLCSVGGMAYYQRPGQDLTYADYIPLPCSMKWIYNVVSTVRFADLYAKKVTLMGTTIRYRFVIHNNASTYTFRDVTIWVLHAGHTPLNTLEQDERMIRHNDITVNSNTDYDSGWVSVVVPQSLASNAVLYLNCYAGFDQKGPISPMAPDTPDPIPND